MINDWLLERVARWLHHSFFKRVHWKTLDLNIIGNKAFSEYRRTATHTDGTEEEFYSVDILTFRDELIIHKDTYYKHRTEQ